MLGKLYIRNFALIEELEIQLSSGFNVLTGETGAGKSLLLGAIGLILGKRVDYSMIFQPDKKCIVEATFVNIPQGILAVLEKMEDFDLEDGPQVVIRREASGSGKSRAFINDTPVQITLLRQVTSMLVDLHGQHENQRLLSAEQQLQLLDQYAGTTKLSREFGQHLQAARSIEKQIAQLKEEEQRAREQQDYFRFQLQELEEAQLLPGEAEQLEQQLKLLSNAEEVQQSLGLATRELYDDEASVYNRLSEIGDQLERIADLDPEIRSHTDQINELRFVLEEASRSFEKVADGIETDPETLQELEERLTDLTRLLRKFNVGSVEELIAVRDKYQEKVARFDNLGSNIDGLLKDLQKYESAMVKTGLALEKKRQKAAPILKKEIDQLLFEVGLENAAFDVSIDRTGQPDGSLEIDGEKFKALTNGLNQVAFRIRTNKGMPWGNLADSASGGEVSRVMLAIKAALASKAELSVLIFDEIDTGISGEVANKVGKVMQKLSAEYQLIAITHLPQIAGKGHSHFKIYKEIEGETTVSNVRPLAQEDRILELAKMLSGENPSESALLNAKELLAGDN